MLVQVIAPYDAEDARGLLKASIRDPDPVVFLENEILYGATFPVEEKVLDKDFVLPIGKCKVRSDSETHHQMPLACSLHSLVVAYSCLQDAGWYVQGLVSHLSCMGLAWRRQPALTTATVSSPECFELLEH